MEENLSGTTGIDELAWNCEFGAYKMEGCLAGKVKQTIFTLQEK